VWINFCDAREWFLNGLTLNQAQFGTDILLDKANCTEPPSIVKCQQTKRCSARTRAWQFPPFPRDNSALAFTQSRRHNFWHYRHVYARVHSDPTWPAKCPIWSDPNDKPEEKFWPDPTNSRWRQNSFLNVAKYNISIFNSVKFILYNHLYSTITH